jgi:hypothetical protein
MMKRYYSHYTFIYPDILLKNHIVEVNSEYQITRIFPFDKETERTEFYSGLLLFLQDNAEESSDVDMDIIDRIRSGRFSEEPLTLPPLNKKYKVIHKEYPSLTQVWTMQ